MLKEDLMIGDLVYRPDCYDTVKEIRENGIIGTDSFRGIIGFNELKPIPLTPEIFEKNGWKWDGMYATKKHDNTMYFTYYLHEGILRDFYDHKSGEQELIFRSRPGMRYVHELQHALKLCGIDKKIVLSTTHKQKE